MSVTENKPLVALLGVGLMSAAMSVQATVFQMESFQVEQNGATYWLDEFDNASPPAHISLEDPAVVDVNLHDRAYLVAGGGQLLGPEAGDKLTIDTDQGVLTDSTVNPGVKVKVQRARVNSATNPALPAALTIDDAIAVTGVFDLIAPELRETYRVRLTDWDSTSQNESLEVGVGRRASDNEVVAFFRKGIAGGGFTLIDALQLSLIPDIGDFEQIGLLLGNNPQTAGADFSAAIELIDTDGVLGNSIVVFQGTGTMFNQKAWVRPGFIAVQRVPVPATLVLMLAGLTGLGLWRRRKG